MAGGYDNGYIEGRAFLRIIFEEEHLVSILMFDTNPFWPQVLEFMGHIACGHLPAACEHLRVVEWHVAPERPTEFRTLTRLVAEPLEAAENFRLKIFTRHQDEPEFMLFDEVVHRRQFTRGFMTAFQAFLKNEYRIEPDKAGQTFDLRTLALENLDQV